ncbi:hypothetical protein SHKM778_79450 [Streptomyces sp. KM77-8]|uniref:Uncharacterized protein n=1 Tax=Streptomyces haneummycinicus TaxID=3074435 RepID=A0AAT9HX40_9ACTN
MPPRGPWRQLLPGVVLLHCGPPTSEERLHAVLLYAARERTGVSPPNPARRVRRRPATRRR